MRNIEVLVLDYDGCGDKQEVREKALKLLSEEYPESAIVLVVGSNRQDAKLNQLNHANNNNGNCYEVFAAFARENGIIFDPMLTVDLCKGLEDGHGQQGRHDQDTHHLCEDCKYRLFDLDNKAPIILSLAHRLREKHPDAKNLRLHFFDDKAGILAKTQQLFLDNPQALPRGLDLHCYHVFEPVNSALEAMELDVIAPREPYRIESFGQPVSGIGLAISLPHLRENWHAFFEIRHFIRIESRCCGLFLRSVRYDSVLASDYLINNHPGSSVVGVIDSDRRAPSI